MLDRYSDVHCIILKFAVCWKSFTVKCWEKEAMKKIYYQC